MKAPKGLVSVATYTVVAVRQSDDTWAATLTEDRGERHWYGVGPNKRTAVARAFYQLAADILDGAS